MNWDHKISDLELLADSLLERKRTQYTARPFFVEFVGAAFTDTSLSCNALRDFLRNQNYSVKMINVETDYAATNFMRSPHQCYMSLLQLMQKLMVILSKEQNHYDIVLINGGVLEHLCWLNMLCSQYKMDKAIQQYLSHFFLSTTIRSVIDTIVQFDFVAAVLMANHINRNYKTAREEVTQEFVMEEQSLIRVTSSYSAQYKDHYQISKLILKNLIQVKIEDVDYGFLENAQAFKAHNQEATHIPNSLKTF